MEGSMNHVELLELYKIGAVFSVTGVLAISILVTILRAVLVVDSLYL